MFSEPLQRILKRWKPAARSGLLPALIEAQEELGWLSKETLVEIAQGLQVPLAEAYGVADFYAHLYTEPVGKTFVRVCDDVVCYLAGSEKLCAAVQARLGLRAGETSRDGAHTLEIVPCLGHCDQAPVMMIGKNVFANVQPDHIEALLPSNN